VKQQVFCFNKLFIVVEYPKDCRHFEDFRPSVRIVCFLFSQFCLSLRCIFVKQLAMSVAYSHMLMYNYIAATPLIRPNRFFVGQYMATRKKLQVELAVQKANNSHQIKIEQQKIRRLEAKVCFLLTCIFVYWIWDCHLISCI
jgi:hypothetical protein